ncbi:hypothetical protein D1872_274620 [compost metagenome]
MALEPDKTFLLRLLDKLFLKLFGSEAEGDVHQRAVRRLRRAAVETAAVVDRPVQQVRLLPVLRFDPFQGPLLLDPLQYFVHHINPEGWRCIVKRVVLRMRIIAEIARQMSRRILQQFFSGDDYRDAGRSQILLGARIDESELRQVKRAA